MSSLKSIALFASLAATAGCGGGAGGLGNLNFSPVGSGPITTAELQRLESDAMALENAFGADDVTFSVPSVASAKYDGLIGIDLDTNSSLLGRVTLNANFSVGSVSGSAGDFSVMDDTTSSVSTPIETLSGSLPITSGVISSYYDMTAIMNGSLAGASGTYTATTTLDGSFIDMNGVGVVGGAVDGNLMLPDTSNITAFGAFLGVAR